MLRTSLRLAAVAAAALLALVLAPVATAAPTPAATFGSPGATGLLAMSCPPDDPCPRPTCFDTACGGLLPDNTNCDGSPTTKAEAQVAILNGTLQIRHSAFCDSNWARILFNSGGDCAMSGIAIQRREYSGGAWHNGPIQDVTKGPGAFCSGGSYWTRMVGGDPGQVRTRYAEGYYATGCSSDCLRFNWHAWYAWHNG